MRAPRPMPARRSFRYSFDHAARPGSTGCGKERTRLATSPAEVMTTTITVRGCSTRTSTCRTVAVETGGAVTTASRSVTADSVSLVTRIASSTSRCTSSSSTGGASTVAGSRWSTK